MAKHAIIGSGITALARARHLLDEEEEVTILEPGSQIGGAIRSHRKGPYLAEEGPNSIQVNSPEVDRFLRSIPGIESRWVTASRAAKKRFILRAGRPLAVPMGPLQAMTTPLWSLRGKLRVLREPFVAPAAADAEESAAAFVRRRLGDELYRYAINPLIGGIYAGDPEQLSLRYAFPKLHALEQRHGGLIRGGIAKMRATRQPNAPRYEKRILSFREGLGELPALLAAQLGDRLQHPVDLHSIEQTATGWRIRFDDRSDSFDTLVLTTPAHALSTLPLPAALQERLKSLQQIDYPPVSVLSMAFARSEVQHPLDGFGLLVPECEQRSVLGVLFPSSIFPDRAPADEVMLTLFVGGERQPELATADCEALKSLVLPELRALLGVRGPPRFTHLKHWDRAIPQYKLGYGEILRNIETIENDFSGLELRGNYRHGISLSYCIEAA